MHRGTRSRIAPSRYVDHTVTRKARDTPGRLEKVKFNHFMKKRTLHREVR